MVPHQHSRTCLIFRSQGPCFYGTYTYHYGGAATRSALARQMPRIALCVFLAMHPVYTSTSDTAAALQEDYKFLNLVRPFPAV